MVWLLLHPPSHEQVGSLSQTSSVSPLELSDGREVRRGVGGGLKSNDGEKTWSSIYLSVSLNYSLAYADSQWRRI
jgi:hypothetical protein